jgi:hypothetical protein
MRQALPGIRRGASAHHNRPVEVYTDIINTAMDLERDFTAQDIEDIRAGRFQNRNRHNYNPFDLQNYFQNNPRINNQRAAEILNTISKVEVPDTPEVRDAPDISTPPPPQQIAEKKHKQQFKYLKNIIQEEYSKLLQEQDANELLNNIRRVATPSQIIPPEEVEWGLTPPENRVASHDGAWLRHTAQSSQTHGGRGEAQNRLETDLINQWKEQGTLPQEFNLDWYRWHQRDKTDPPGHPGPRFKPLEWEGPSPTLVKDPVITT